MLFLLHDSFILDSSTRFIHHEIEIWTIIQQLQKLLEILFVSFKKNNLDFIYRCTFCAKLFLKNPQMQFLQTD